MTGRDYVVETHIETLRSALLSEYQVSSQAKWIQKNTWVGGKPYSFAGHEYQKKIIEDEAQVKSIKKCSQIGISEASVRILLAFSQMHTGVTTIYVLPTATFAQTFSKTRVSTAIDESPNIANSLKPGNDSSSLKIFKNGSQIYFRGAASGSAAISIPADFLIFDEKNFFEYEDIQTQYMSRLTHSDFKNILNLSTPTLPGRGISDDFDKSMQFVELTKCCHCNHYFDPNYFEHVKLPGFNVKRRYKTKKVRSLNYFCYSNRHKLAKYDLKEAYLACPKCGKPVDRSIKYREWVCVNPESNIEPHAYHIKPFSCPKFISPGDLIKASTTYKLYSDFVNFSLGEDHDSSENSLTSDELEKIFYQPESVEPKYTIAGLDLGGLCYMTIAKPKPDSSGFRVVHVEAIPIRELVVRYPQLCAKYKVICTVADSMPYTTDIIRMQKTDPNLWGAVFTTSKNVELFKIAEKDEDKDKATFGMRQIDISRDKTLDFVVDMIRSGGITYTNSPMKETIISHLRDLKRQKKLDKYGEEVFIWKKSAKGEDHCFFSLLYCTVALFMMGTVHGTVSLPFLMAKINTLTEEEAKNM